MSPSAPAKSRLLSGLEGIGRTVQLLGQTVLWAVRPPYDWSELWRQMGRLGVGSIPVVFFTAVFTGMVIALQTYTGFARFKAEGFTGGIVALSVMREIAPVFTALIVTGRVGSLIAAELSSMRSTEQIDALRAMGTEPVQYLFVPRVLAGMVMLPLLQVMADAVAIGGGRVAAVSLLGANSSDYDLSTFHLLQRSDFLSGPIKSVVFGLLLTLIACVKGYESSGGAEGVGRAATAAVVTASGAIVLADFVLSKLIF